jgi:hypothetical protein
MSAQPGTPDSSPVLPVFPGRNEEEEKSRTGARRSRLRALLLLAPLARAGDETQRIEPRLEARVWSPWPETVHKGWAPIFVEIRNEDRDERLVEIEAECHDWNNERRVETRVLVAPDSSVALELLVPLGGVYMNGYQVQIHGERGSAYFGSTVGSSSANPAFRPVLLLGERVPEAGAVERWSEAVSSTTIEKESYGFPRIVVRGSGPAPVTPSTAPNDVDLVHSGFAGMPRHHAGYSSLDLVVLDPEGGMPSEAQLAPLVAWVKIGGDLLVIGARARAAAMAVPALAAWMEARFETNHAEGSVYRCGLGRLFVGDVEGDLDGDYADWVRRILEDDASLTPEQGPWRGAGLEPTIPGLARLPYRAFAALLILFAIVIGPVNFLAVRRRKRPVLLLLTIPAIALVTTVALLAYGIFFQGVDVKSASRSVAVLDQREHRSACVEARQFFAGLAPAAGLALGPGTIVHAWPHDGRGSRRYEVDLEGGALLAGDFLPSRKATTQLLAVERAERARLDVRRAGDALAVDNNLGVGLEELIVRDPEGRFYRSRGALGPGTSADLRATSDENELGTAIGNVLDDTLPLTTGSLPSLDAIPPGGYLARLAASPFRDDCGIEMNELTGKHVVLGVLPLEPEAWR